MAPPFLQSVVLGFSIAAPVGPIGVLCIRRTLAEGWAVGLASGLGAATADAGYGLIAALGISALTSALVGAEGVLRVVGSLYLVILGVRTFVTAPAERAAASRPDGGRVARAWLSTVVLTATNPATIMSFAAVFSSLGAAAASGRAPVIVAGVFTGSAGWWLLLASAVARLQTRIDNRHLVWVNRASGIVLVGFAVYAVAAGSPSGS